MLRPPLPTTNTFIATHPRSFAARSLLVPTLVTSYRPDPSSRQANRQPAEDCNLPPNDCNCAADTGKREAALRKPLDETVAVCFNTHRSVRFSRGRCFERWPENVSRRLSGREFAILKLLWSSGPLTVREVREHLANKDKVREDIEDDLPYTTVLSLLQLMERKGYVDHSAEGKTYRYRALLERSKTTRLLIRDFVAGFSTVRPTPLSWA